MNTRLASTLIVLGLLAVWTFGGWLLFRGAFAEQRIALASRAWPAAAGTIIKSQRGTRYVTIKQHTRTVQTPEIGYRYTVGGIKYHGTRIRFAMIPNDETAALLQQHPVGAVIQVRYDPNQPSESVLQPPSGADAGWLPQSSRIIFIAYVALPLVMLGFILGAAALAGKTAREIASEALAAIERSRGASTDRNFASIAAARDILFGKRSASLRFAGDVVLRENVPDEEYSCTTRNWSLEIDNTNATFRRWTNHAAMFGAEQKHEIEATVPLNSPLPESVRDWLPSLCAAFSQSKVRLRLPEFQDAGATALARQRKPNAITGIKAWLVLGLLFVVGIPMQIINAVAAGVANAWDLVRGRKR
ncbi:MAG: DUF3592 domain-containing protein [Verrucomicrobiaceae bacterium]|nr:DUF3592 domain-containing protein [Verrucomicrobiaceae bacterium]